MRNKLKRRASKVTHIKRGDKRISSSSRVCSICGRSLSTYDKLTGKAFASHDHLHLVFSEVLQLDICHKLSDCYKYKNEEWFTFEVKSRYDEKPTQTKKAREWRC